MNPGTLRLMKRPSGIGGKRKAVVLKVFKVLMQHFKYMGSGCGSVGRAVGFDIRSAVRLQSSSKFILNICLFTCFLSTVLKR